MFVKVLEVQRHLDLFFFEQKPKLFYLAKQLKQLIPAQVIIEKLFYKYGVDLYAKHGFSYTLQFV